MTYYIPAPIRGHFESYLKGGKNKKDSRCIILTLWTHGLIEQARVRGMVSAARARNMPIQRPWHQEHVSLTAGTMTPAGIAAVSFLRGFSAMFPRRLR